MIHSLGWGKTMQEIAMVMPVYRGSMGDIGRGQRLESILGFAERLSVPLPSPRGETGQKLLIWLELGQPSH